MEGWCTREVFARGMCVHVKVCTPGTPLWLGRVCTWKVYARGRRVGRIPSLFVLIWSHVYLHVIFWLQIPLHLVSATNNAV